MKRRVWIKNGDVVLVAPWDFQTSRADVIWRYTQNQAQVLQNKGILSMPAVI
jgi:translation initiation factor 1A